MYIHVNIFKIYTVCVCIYINIINKHSTHTLTGRFIEYSLLVPGWTPFVFRTALILRGIDSQGVGKIPQRFWSILT